MGRCFFALPSGACAVPPSFCSAADNAEYSKLVDAFIKSAYTLRYTGGMVPDVHHLIAKVGGGVVKAKGSDTYLNHEMSWISGLAACLSGYLTQRCNECCAVLPIK
eukprot:1103477-Pelagomonas_calceolata.AAC.7